MKNIMNIMKQAKDLQSKMADMQAQVEAMTASGAAGGGLVSVTLNGKGALVGVRIDPSLLKESEAEILEDLIVAAHSDAKGRIEAALAEKMQAMAGGLPLPPGFKLF
jgi:DNA-binding YbaB/EbfC family protein